MNWNAAHGYLCQGKKVRRNWWDGYVHFVDGVLRTSNGSSYHPSFVEKTATDWEIFEEPVLETKFTYADLYPAMIVGKKIRRKSWRPDFYIYIPVTNDGHVTSSSGDRCSIPRWEMTQTDWEIVEESKPEPVEVKPELTAKDVEIFYTNGKIEGIKALRARYGKKNDGTNGYVVGLKEAKDLFDVLPVAITNDQYYRGVKASDLARMAAYGFSESDINADTLYAVESGPLLGAYLAYAHNKNKG